MQERRIGGFTEVISVTPTIETGAYGTGDLIGEKLTFANAARVGDSFYSGTGIVQSVVLVDQDVEEVTIDLVLFDDDPDGTTFTDNSALDIADADMSKIIGVAQIATYYSFSDNSVGVVSNLGLPFDLGAATSIYGALVSRGAPTYTATSDLIVRLGILQD